MSDSLELSPIGFIRTPFSEKFGIPRQPGLVPSALGEVELYEEFKQAGIYDGLDQCSHLWLSFWFHQQNQDWAPKVRPPRLGGNKKMGVFATRSPKRPNPIGLSVVRLVSVNPQLLTLTVSGVDLLDGTPILDIKPYVPYTDCLPEAQHQMAPTPPSPVSVEYAPEALESLAKRDELKHLITQVLSQDPRPAYHQDEREYGTALAGFNVRWRFQDERIQVRSIVTL